MGIFQKTHAVLGGLVAGLIYFAEKGQLAYAICLTAGVCCHILGEKALAIYQRIYAEK